MQKNDVQDQLSRKITVTSGPERIISLVPSQTELLFDLGLDDAIIGITKFCVHPYNKCKQKIKIGGTKKLNIPRIHDLKPDLIIANKEENLKEDIELLAEDYAVWVSDIYNVNDALAMINSIGEITNSTIAASTIVNSIQEKLKTINNIFKNNRVIYLIWKNPMMAAGTDTFIHSLLTWCGLENVVKEKRYPVIKPALLDEADLVLLSTEPYPFKESHVKEFMNISKNARYKIVDGEMFSWYGSRLLHLPDYITSISKDFMSAQKLG